MENENDMQNIKDNTAEFVGGLFAFVTLVNRFLPLIEKLFNRRKTKNEKHNKENN